MSVSRPEIIVDTNVAVVANNKEPTPERRACAVKCIARLRHIQATCCLLLDDQNLILTEYQKELDFSGQPGTGDAFFKWLFENQARQKHCRKVHVRPHPERGFEEFPEAPDLNTFDRDDRMFVAIAVASGTSPQVLNASDTDWWDHHHALQQHGVEVVFLCPALMKKHQKKR